MDKRIFIFGFVLILLSSFVSAYLPTGYNDSILFYLSLDDDSYSAPEYEDISGLTRDYGRTAGTTGASGILEEAFNSAGAGFLANGDAPKGLTDISINMWVKVSDWATNHQRFITENINKNTIILTQTGTGYTANCGTKSICWFSDTNGGGLEAGEVLQTSWDDAWDNVWTMITVTCDGADCILYVNGVSKDTGILTNNIATPMTNTTICSDVAGTSRYCNGAVDEIGYWSSELTQTNITELYNGGNGFNPFKQTSSISYFELTLIDAVGDSLSNFTANFTNSTAMTNITTTNGTIYYPEGQIVNITIFNITHLNWNYQNTSNTSINTSAGNLQAQTDIFDNIHPTITLNALNGFNLANFSTENQFDDNLSLNITFGDERDLYGFLINITRTGTSYYNYTNYTINGTSRNYNTILNTSLWPAATYEIEIRAYDSKTRDRGNISAELHNNKTQYNSWFRGNYTKLEPLLFSSELGNLSILLTDDSTISNITGVLYFNGTLQANTTSYDIGSFWNILEEISAPSGTYIYNWIVNITQGDGSPSQANITGTFTFYEFGIDDCSVFTHTTVYLNIWNENVPTAPLNATVEIDSDIWISSPDNSRQFNQLLTGNSTYKLCLLNPNSTFYTDMYIKYTTDDGFTHRYYLVNETLTNESFNVSMYNYNYTSGVSDMKITVRDYDTYQYFPNVITKLQRRYLEEGVWRTVQMDESGDFGLIFFNVREENTDYRILFYDRNNNLLKTTESMKFICDSGVCQLTFTVSPYAVIMVAEPVEVLYSFNNATKILSVIWTDPDAATKTVRTLVSKETITGVVDICDQTQTGASGSVTCNVSLYSGDIFLSVWTENLAAESVWIHIPMMKLGSVINVLEASVWTFGIMLTVAMFGLFVGAVGSIISTLIGLIAVYFLGLFNPITLTFIIIAAALGVVIGAKLRN